MDKFAATPDQRIRTRRNSSERLYKSRLATNANCSRANALDPVPRVAHLSTMPSQEASANPTGQKEASVRLLTILAFAAIYLIWGSTFLAIRIAVASVPPLLAAGLRFLFAGAVLYAWARVRGGAAPSRIEWRNLIVLSALLFLIAYGGVFWAE